MDRIDHHSTREINDVYFLVTDASRVLSFWLMTKSVNSTFEQQSQRYVKVNGSQAYEDLIKLGIPKEDARYVLPQSTKTNFFMKTNLRELENLIFEFYSKDYPSEVYEFLEKVMENIEIEYPFSSKKLIREMGKRE